MKRILAGILALAMILALAGCGKAGVETAPQESGSAAQGETAADAPPAVTGPNKAGRFPAILWEDFNRWVSVGEPETEADRPEKAPAAFLDMPDCVASLAMLFPKIDDWQILFEADEYYLYKGMYDPYRYQWRDQWTPQRIVAMATAQSAAFDRIVLIATEACVVNSYKDGYADPEIAQQTAIFTGWEKDLRAGDLSGAELIPSDSDAEITLAGCSAIRLSDGRGLLLVPNTDQLLPVSDLTAFSQGTTASSAACLKSYAGIDPEAAGDATLLYMIKAGSKERSRVYTVYYDPATQRAAPMEGANGESPQLFVLDGSRFVLQSDGQVNFYDLTADAPEKPYAAIGGDGLGLSDGEVWIMYQLATDREHPDRHCFMYYIKGEDEWRVCAFDTGGTVLSDFSTGLPVVENYIGSTVYAGGLAYFVYYSGGSGDAASYAQYCVDARAGRDHTPERIG